MKSLYAYIKEEYQNQQLNELTVKFKLESKDLILEVPKNFMEDKIQTYLDDTILNKLFVGPDYSKKILGKNSDNVTDAYFEYSGLTNVSGGVVELKYDSHYETDEETDDLHKVKLSDFTFVVTFDKFTIKLENTNDDEVKETLIQVFNMCVSDDYEWPLKFNLDTDSIEYRTL